MFGYKQCLFLMKQILKVPSILNVINYYLVTTITQYLIYNSCIINLQLNYLQKSILSFMKSYLFHFATITALFHKKFHYYLYLQKLVFHLTKDTKLISNIQIDCNLTYYSNLLAFTEQSRRFSSKNLCNNTTNKRIILSNLKIP